MIEFDLLLVLVKRLLLLTFRIFDLIADLLLLAGLLLPRLTRLARVVQLEAMLQLVEVAFASGSECEDRVGSHWEEVVVEEAFVLQLLNGK